MNSKIFIQQKFSLFSATVVFLISVFLTATTAEAQEDKAKSWAQRYARAVAAGCPGGCEASSPGYGDLPVNQPPFCVNATRFIYDGCAKTHNYSGYDPTIVSVNTTTGEVTGLQAGTTTVTYSGIWCDNDPFSEDITITVSNTGDCSNGVTTCTVECGEEYDFATPTITNPNADYTGVWQIDDGSGWIDFTLPHTFVAADDGAQVRYVLVNSASTDSIFSPNVVELTVANCPSGSFGVSAADNLAFIPLAAETDEQRTANFAPVVAPFEIRYFVHNENK
jgi:hypothetical protein